MPASEATGWTKPNPRERGMRVPEAAHARRACLSNMAERTGSGMSGCVRLRHMMCAPVSMWCSFMLSLRWKLRCVS